VRAAPPAIGKGRCPYPGVTGSGNLIASYEQMARANAGFLPAGFTVLAPFIGMTKAGIASLAALLGVPVDQTRSCYRGGDAHCGTCATCTERRKAFALAGLADPTVYLSG
jgi:7-cyano-7-deazaguanine synthase